MLLHWFGVLFGLVQVLYLSIPRVRDLVGVGGLEQFSYTMVVEYN